MSDNAAIGQLLSVPPDADAYRRSRRVADFYARAKPGPLFYAAGILVIAFVGHYFEQYWPLVAIWTIAYLLLGLMRIGHRPPGDGNDRATTNWWREHWAIEKLGCLFWTAALTGVGLIEGRPNTVFLIAVICTLAYATAVTDAFALAPRQAMASLALLIWPSSALLFFSQSSLRSALVTLGVYSLYLLAYAYRRGKEYTRQLDTEVELLTSRAAVERLSRTDVLTGLANRREYLSVIDWAWQQAQRNGEILSLLVVDLDHFKHINDRYGHANGDVALAHAASVLRETFRRTNDFVARIGGEEFVVLLPGMDTEDALKQAEVFRSRLEATRCELNGHAVALTASIGVGRVDYARDNNPDDSFVRVDRACFLAKEQGRNRIVATDTPT